MPSRSVRAAQLPFVTSVRRWIGMLMPKWRCYVIGTKRKTTRLLPMAPRATCCFERGEAAFCTLFPLKEAFCFGVSTAVSRGSIGR